MNRTKSTSQIGHAVLEFALGWAVLWMLFTGVYQFGYGLYVYNLAEMAVSNAAAMGSSMTYDTSRTAQFTSALQNMVVYGQTTAGATPIVPGLSTANVTVNVHLQNSIPVYLTIGLNDFSIDALFTRFTLQGKPRVTTVFMGKVTCSTC